MAETHFINREAFDFLLNDKFDEFLATRENLIIGRIKTLPGADDASTSRSLISPKNPFSNSNEIAFANTIRECSEYVYWLDKYFSKKGLELLAESIENGSISAIRILMAIEKVDEVFRKHFKNFKDEMSNKGVNCDLRVITDSKPKSSIHDRFIISKYDSYNIPSPDIIARGQLSEILKSKNRDELLKEFNNRLYF